ncbi:lantibiotic dehydratase [Streptomyces bohaiensis]|uniref:lantibiotic dehydratase n=1 Tax=Streptomyces bohaiensis TaxID=1431344 RepID=UPI003B77C5F3
MTAARTAHDRCQWQPGAMLRATTDPGGLELPRELDLNDPASAHEWLGRLWEREELREALDAASPALRKRVDEILAGERRDARRVRRAALSVATYLLRWRSRATPFGLFAGIAPAHVGAEPSVRWGTKHRQVSRPDAAWPTDMVARLHACGELLEQLPVVANNTVRMRGDRLVAQGPPGADDGASLLGPLEVSVRRTPPTVAALGTAAQGPIRFGKLRDALAARFPEAPPARIASMLRGLVEQNFLVTSLHAPMTETDPQLHLHTELAAADAADHPALAGSARAASAADTVLDCRVTLPEQVAVEAAEAADVLCHVSPHPFGAPAWRDYHARFRARYGTGAVVPLLELIADSGLGLPAGFPGSRYQHPPKQLTGRDTALLRLVQQAAMEGTGEIVLTASVIAQLTTGSENITTAPRSEVAFQVHAATVEDLSGGRFRLLITGTPRPGSSMAGRFAHLLPPDDLAQLAETYRPTADPEAIAAQLSYAPRRRRNETIARTTRLLPYVIPIAEHRPADENGVIHLADLAVTADRERFVLVHLSTGRPVEPRVTHALEAAVHTPPLARFLAEITTARCAVYRSFDFGAAASLPYLPRVRYRRTVLAAARWLLDVGDLPGRGGTPGDWDAALARWRGRLEVPEQVTLVEHDPRLVMDLAHPAHRVLLRHRLATARRLELREALDGSDLGWLGRAHEILLPLKREEPARQRHHRPRNPIFPSSPVPPRLPGRSPVLHARLTAHPDRFDEILTGHLHRLIHTFAAPPLWWFSRHRDAPYPGADQHLALFLRLPEADAYGPAAAHFHDWAATLRDVGLLAHVTLDTYEPRTGRYGHGSAMEAATAVFAADSSTALAQIRAAATTSWRTPALAAASLTDLAARLAPSADDGYQWLITQLPRECGPLDSDARDQALALMTPAHRPVDVTTAWHHRNAALVTYSQALAAQQRDPLAVLSSLLRSHHLRAVGIDTEHERTTLRLARACALAHAARRPH